MNSAADSQETFELISDDKDEVESQVMSISGHVDALQSVNFLSESEGNAA